MTEKNGKFILTQEEHDEAIKLAEQLVYSGGISHEMVVHAARLESWEVSDVEHDIIHKKRSRLQQLRDLVKYILYIIQISDSLFNTVSQIT